MNEFDPKHQVQICVVCGARLIDRAWIMEGPKLTFSWLGRLVDWIADRLFPCEHDWR